MTATSSAEKTHEDQTLRGILAGEPQALEAWFLANKDPLYAFIYYRVGGDPDLAADATQATFAEALGRLSDFDPDRGEMTTWLRMLSRNNIRSVLSTRRRGVELQMAWDRIDESLRAAFEKIDSAPLPDDVVERRETRELVEMTLANLPPQYRDVLEAKYFENLSLEAIAGRRATSIDGVKSMLRRARESFRECFTAMAALEVSDA